jgi:hypothetical protein
MIFMGAVSVQTVGLSKERGNEYGHADFDQNHGCSGRIACGNEDESIGLDFAQHDKHSEL